MWYMGTRSLESVAGSFRNGLHQVVTIGPSFKTCVDQWLQPGAIHSSGHHWSPLVPIWGCWNQFFLEFPGLDEQCCGK